MQQLTPKQVARAIGVSDASLKRWCDKGVLPSVRTAGGHRRLPLDGVLAFLRRTGRGLVRPDLLGLPPTTGTGLTVASRAVDQLLDAVEHGDETKFVRIVFDLFIAGQSPHQVCDGALVPLFTIIGERWQAGRLEIYQERRACEMCTCALRRLATLLPETPADAPLAIGGTPETDPYSIPTLMTSIVLQSAGLRTVALGGNLPIATIITAMKRMQPQMLWLSVSWVADGDRFIREYERLYEAAHRLGVAMIVGGRWLTVPTRARMRYATYCDTFSHTLGFVQSWLGNGRATAAKSPTAEGNGELG